MTNDHLSIIIIVNSNKEQNYDEEVSLKLVRIVAVTTITSSSPEYDFPMNLKMADISKAQVRKFSAIKTKYGKNKLELTGSFHNFDSYYLPCPWGTIEQLPMLQRLRHPHTTSQVLTLPVLRTHSVSQNHPK